MNSFVKILKITLLAALLVGLAFGYIFFRAWQKNERPEITESSWSSSEILLGHASTLTVNVQAPWHRVIESPTPYSHPAFLAPVLDDATVTKGPLSLNGTRSWTITVPFVATDTKSTEGLTATFPIKSTKRISPTSLTAPLPTLTILTPEEIPESPRIPNTFLTEEEPPAPPQELAGKEASRNPWLWALLVLLLIPFLIYFLKKSGIIKTTPPWEKALGNLAKLDPKTDPIPFYSKLTDILRQYTSDRFSVRARSKTSTEFISVIRNHPLVPKEQIEELTSFAHLADAVKFADHDPDSDKAPLSLDLIRAFVTNTTPEPEEDKAKK